MTILKKLLLVGFFAVAGLVLLSAYVLKICDDMKYINQSLTDIGKVGGIANALGVNIEKYISYRKQKYVSAFNAEVDEVRAITEELMYLVERQGFQIDIAPLMAGINLTENEFNEVEQQIKTIGETQNEGLRGRLRSAIREAENKIKAINAFELNVLILTLRRHEKDFLLRMDVSYVDRFARTLDDTREYVATSLTLNSALKGEVNELLSVYADGFYALVDAYKTLGLDSESGMQGRLIEADVQLISVVDQFHETYIKLVSAYSADVQRTMMIISVLAISLVSLLIGLVIRTIQKRQQGINNEMTLFVSQLENNQYSYDSRLSLGTEDELNQIVKSTNKFLAKLESMVADQQRALEDSLRDKMALDAANVPIILVDSELKVMYLNQSAQQLMKEHSAALGAVTSRVNYDNLIGTSIEQIHSDPAAQRHYLSTLDDTHHSLLELAGLTFSLTATPIFSIDQKPVATVIEWIDKTQELARAHEEKVKANENERIRQALDNVSTNIMIADRDHNIIYTNAAVEAMLRKNEAIFQRNIKGFNAATVLGSNIDVFHKVPARQRQIVDGMTKLHRSEITLEDTFFILNISPVYDNNNERIGSVVEWVERTEEVHVQRNVDALITAAAHGDLSQRIDVGEITGSFKTLCDGLNNLIEIADGVVTDTARVFSALSHGDLTATIEQHYEGAFGQLKTDANATVSKLTEVMSQIHESATTVASGADEIAQGNADLSQRTEEQASSLEETAASMEQMTSTVKSSAQNAVDVNELAKAAQELAVGGGHVVNDAVDAMSEINSASEQIAEIIGVIDEIAFQTNLLALNAAVEAARAGEQGRGFAVVASEVRNLAQRSAGAAKEIKDLIRDTVKKVNSGSELVNKSGNVLQDIVDSVGRVSTMVDSISNSAQEQSSGIEQVNKAISQMDETTQQNAALVEQATAAGETMAEQARKLAKLVSFFSLANQRLASQGIDSAPAPTPTAVAAPTPTLTPTPTPVQTSATNTGLAVSDDENEWEEF